MGTLLYKMQCILLPTRWPSVDGYNNNILLLAQGYNGTAIIPYSSFGKSGNKESILMMLPQIYSIAFITFLIQ